MEKRSIETDYLLFQKGMQGDQNAMEKLYAGIDEYLKKYLYKYSKKLRIPISEIDNISCDILTKSYHKISSYNGTCLFSTWICSLAFYTALQYQDKKRKYYDQNLLYEDTRLYKSKDLLEPLILEELNITMKYAFESLEEPLKEIMKLKIFYVYTFREIGEELGLPSSTVYLFYKKACKRLKEKFLYYYEEEPSFLL